MSRTEALKQAQIRYRQNNRERINEYVRNYERDNYTQEKKELKAKYYELNKERIKEKSFEDKIFTGFRRLMKQDFR